MSMSFRGLSERCQYWHSARGLGNTTPAVYTAWKMPSQLTRRVISYNEQGGDTSAWVSGATDGTSMCPSKTAKMVVIRAFPWAYSVPFSAPTPQANKGEKKKGRGVTLMRVGATRFERSFLCTQRKLISTRRCSLHAAVRPGRPAGRSG